MAKRSTRRGKRWYCPKVLRWALYMRDMFTCQYCGTHVRDMDGVVNYLTLDHLVCRSHGGALLDPRNIVVACNLCNAGRSDTLLEEYATPGALARIAKQIELELNLDGARTLLKNRLEQD